MLLVYVYHFPHFMHMEKIFFTWIFVIQNTRIQNATNAIRYVQYVSSSPFQLMFTICLQIWFLVISWCVYIYTFNDRFSRIFLFIFCVDYDVLNFFFISSIQFNAILHQVFDIISDVPHYNYRTTHIKNL